MNTIHGRMEASGPWLAVPPSTQQLVSPRLPFPAVLMLRMQLVDAEWEASVLRLGKWREKLLC